MVKHERPPGVHLHLIVTHVDASRDDHSGHLLVCLFVSFSSLYAPRTNSVEGGEWGGMGAVDFRLPLFVLFSLFSGTRAGMPTV